jgi:dihydrofolate reductase
VHGSCNLIQTLLKHNLIDEMHMLIFPVAVGKGKRFFGEGTNPSGFKLLSSKISGSGVIIATYGQSEELKTGTFGQDNVPAEK